ncbi:carboxypeptidase-like regulatory domain-containing protein [Aquimarina macrocephali]|uniref:carboxypeptidase-like regulatory domain-containing protein n=1 Tax=Aquimarina macrocephali TaxID=666563 RepID=UPI0009FD1E25|nr:carboxypeptidase-like regulatory domain-containing protein [Aquimarina macrocephali]
MKNQILICLLLIYNSVMAQQTITGTIYSDNNMPLPGCNVLVKGTSKGALTDFDGRFTINTQIGDTLVVSYLGFKTKEIVITKSIDYTIYMESNASELEQVVVVGYGTQKENLFLQVQ